MSEPTPAFPSANPPRLGWWVGLTVVAWHLGFFATGAVSLALASSPAGSIFEGLAEPVHQDLLFASHLQVLAGYAVVALGVWALTYPIVRLWTGTAPVTRWGVIARSLSVLGVLMAHGWLRLVHTQPYFLGSSTYNTWYFKAVDAWPEELKARVFFVLFWFLPAVVLVAAAGVYVVEAARWFREGGRTARLTLATCSAGVLLAAGWWVAPHFIRTSRNSADGRLNVLVVSADALRVPTAATGAVRPQPTVAALASNSLVLTNVHSPLPSALGEAATLHTGQVPHTHGLQTPFPSQAKVESALKDAPLLPAVLATHGYATAALGDEGAGPIALARGLGFAEVEAGNPAAYPRHLAGLVYPAHFIIPTWLDNRLGRRILPDLMVLPDRVSHDTVTERLTQRLEQVAEDGTPFFIHGVYARSEENEAAPANNTPESESADFDTQLARLIDCLDDTGLRDNTILVLLGRPPADTPTESSSPGQPHPSLDSRVPVVFHLPSDQFAPGEVRQLARLYDLAPTLLDVLGLPPDPAMEGVSLVPCFHDRSLRLPLAAYGESAGFPDSPPSTAAADSERTAFRGAVHLDPASGFRLVLNDETAALRRKMRWVRTPNWQLVFTPAPASPDGVDEWQLFDLKSDPACSRDVKNLNPHVWQTLELALRRWADEKQESRLDTLFPQGEPPAVILPGA
ncbi:MAG: sulfatase [Verrucomicrobiales bacterium]